MSTAWPSKKLGDVTTFRNGLWKGEEPPFVRIGVIRNTNFAKDGILDDSDIAMLDVEKKKFEKRKLEVGDIILEKSGGGPKQPVGRVVLFDKTDGSYSFSNFTSAIRVNDRCELDFQFLHKFLVWTYMSGLTETMQSHSTGIRNLNADAYKEILVPLPPIVEQRRIVAVLEETFAGLATASASAEKNLKNARELFKTHLNSIFKGSVTTSTRKRLGEICENLDSKRVPITKKDRTQGSVPYYGASGVVDYVKHFIFNENLLLVSEDGANLLMRTYPIAFSVTGKSWINNHAHVLRFANLSSQRFVEYYLNSVPLDAYISGMAQPKLNQKALNSIVVPFPPLEDQERAVQSLDQLSARSERLLEIYNERIARLTELKQSILQRAFSSDFTSPLSRARKEAAE